MARYRSSKRPLAVYEGVNAITSRRDWIAKITFSCFLAGMGGEWNIMLLRIIFSGWNTYVPDGIQCKHIG